MDEEFGLGEGPNQSRTKLLGPSIKDSEGYKDVFFAVLLACAFLVVSLLGLVNGVAVFLRAIPDEIIVHEDRTTDIHHDQQQFSRLSLFGGVVIVLLTSAAASICSVCVCIKYAENIALISVAAGVVALTAGGLWLLVVSSSIAGGVICLCLAAAVLGIFLVFLRPRLVLASTLLRVAAEALQGTKWTVAFFVLILLAAQVVFGLLWVLALLGVATNEGSQSGETDCVSYRYSGTYAINAQTSLTCADPAAVCEACVCASGSKIISSTSPCFQPKLLISELVLLVFVFLWVCGAIGGVIHCAVSKCVALWWRSSESVPEVHLANAFKKALTVNLGSVALGSLLVTMLQLARMLCSYATAISSRLGSTGSTGRFMASCLAVALQTLEQATTYFNKYALCYCATYDLSFIDASKAVVGLLMSRGFSALVNDDIVDTLLFLADVAAGVATCLVAVLYCRAVGLDVTDSTLLSVSGFFIGWLAASTLTRTLGSAASTVFVLFAESPDDFAEAHPQQSFLLHGCWAQLQGEAGGSNGRDVATEDEAADAFNGTPQFIRRAYAAPAPPTYAPVLPEADDDDGDDEEEHVLNVAPLSSSSKKVKK